ncbi:hypothetical protein OA093_01000, partial [bacterium]|nr:hypothetical protein [bacterium]
MLNLESLYDQFSARSSSQSLSIAFDCQCTQSNASKNRGVGRYVTSLIIELKSLNLFDDIYLFFAPELEIPKEFISDPIFHLIYFENYSLNFENKNQIRIKRTLQIEKFNPDFIFVGHIFEGSDQDEILPVLPIPGSNTKYITIGYDLIPAVLSQHYFRFDEFREWWLAVADEFRLFDMIACISESTRQDLIKYLDIDPEKAFFIGGGASAEFKNLDLKHSPDEPELQEFAGSSYILYVGGDEYRKNIDRLVRGFCIYSKKSKSAKKLIFACNISPATRNYVYAILQENDVDFELLI